VVLVSGVMCWCLVSGVMQDMSDDFSAAVVVTSSILGDLFNASIQKHMAELSLRGTFRAPILLLARALRVTRAPGAPSVSVRIVSLTTVLTPWMRRWSTRACYS